jgi:hypothetical protein
MTLWQFLTNVYVWFSDRATRLLSFVLGTIATLVGTGIVPEAQLKYWAAGIAVLTYWRGQAVSGTVSAAQAIVAQSKSTEVPLAQTITQTIKESQK